MQILLQDIRYALRQLRKSLGFTIVAILTLALGIGANTAIYSIIHGALRLPYPHSDRMIAVQNIYPQGKYFSSSFADFEQWRAETKTLSHLVTLYSKRMNWTGSGNPESVNVDLVSDGYFSMYGLDPIVGRTFSPQEHRQGGAPVCVLTEKFWREKFGGDPSVVGKPINLDGTAYTIVGVAPALINEGRAGQAWIPLEPRAPWREHGTSYLFTTGLLAPGVTESAARAELRNIQGQINRQFPDNKHEVDIQPLSKAIFGDLNSLMWMLQAAVGFILLIACVNLANMLLARAANREREFAVRRALGASPGRMIQQTLTESLLLSITGAAAGLLFAEVLTHIPIAAWPKNFVAPSQVYLDATVMAFTALLAIGTGVLFGLIPALRILRQDDKDALQQGRTVTESKEQTRTRGALVIAEIALSMLLVAGALNVAIYLVKLLHVDPGMNPENTLAMTISLSPARYTKAEDQRRFFNDLVDKLATLPGVTSAGATAATPFTDNGSNGDFSYDGQPESDAAHNPFADFHWVTPGYFSAVQTPLLQGRDFTKEDGPDSPKVVIINRGMAEKFWPGQSALGKRLHCCAKGARYSVIGVVADVRYQGPAEPANLSMYMSADQNPQASMTVILRTHADPMSLTGPTRQAVASIDRGQAVSNITSLGSLEQASIAGQRTSTMVTAILGCLALLLASIGVYGVMAYSVSRREREFGIRMALGANRGNILKMLFAGVLRLAIVGMFIGAAMALAMRQWLQSLLGANGTNPYALLFAALLLCMVAVLATVVPARNAMGVEPMQALRTE